MNAITYIQENANPITLLEYYGFRCVKEYDTEIRACCEIHKGDNENGFVWKKSNNMWYCFTGEDCGGGDVIDLVRKMENIPFKEAIRKAATILNLDIEGLDFGITIDRLKREQKNWLKKNKKVNSNIRPSLIRIRGDNAPDESREGFHMFEFHCSENNNLLFKNLSEINEYKLPYTQFTSHNDQFTRFPDEVLEYYDAKFCSIYPLEDKLLKNKLVIPIKVNDVTVGVGLRDTTGLYKPKWLYQPKGLKTSEMFYPMRTVEEETEELILVEGIFDVWAFHMAGIDNVVAVFGSHLSDSQYKQLVISGCTITLCFDNDSAGVNGTLKAIKKLKGKVDLKQIDLPEGKDPGDCTKDELLSAYLERRYV